MSQQNRDEQSPGGAQSEPRVSRPVDRSDHAVKLCQRTAIQ
jgi:hypothetical protein